MKRTIFASVLMVLCWSAVANAQQPPGGGWRQSNRGVVSHPRYARVAAQPTPRDAGASHAVYWQRVEDDTDHPVEDDLTTIREYPANGTAREYTYNVPVTRREYQSLPDAQNVQRSSYSQPTYVSDAAITLPDTGATLVQSPASVASNCCCPPEGVPAQSYHTYPAFQPLGGDGAQVRPGLLGQPTLYVPGQPLRNAFRFLAL